MFHSELSTPEEKGQRPLTTNPPSARRAPGGEGDGRGDERVGVGVPDLVLRLGIVEREDPVVGPEVAHVPRGGGTAAPELGHDVVSFEHIERNTPAPPVDIAGGVVVEAREDLVAR